MATQYVLVTNNRRFECFSAPDCEVMFDEILAEQVLVKARDYVHRGWKLHNGPLYGNFRAYHQPFRTLLLSLETGQSFDSYGLELLEGALAMYQGSKWPPVTPQNCSEHFVEDYRTIDAELLVETLQQARLIR